MEIRLSEPRGERTEAAFGVPFRSGENRSERSMGSRDGSNELAIVDRPCKSYKAGWADSGAGRADHRPRRDAYGVMSCDVAKVACCACRDFWHGACITP